MCSRATDEKVSDWERAPLGKRGLGKEGLWEEMTFEWRPEEQPAR